MKQKGFRAMSTKTEINKSRSVLENAIPYIFFTHSFPKKEEFPKARLEFVNASLLAAVGLDGARDELDRGVGDTARAQPRRARHEGERHRDRGAARLAA